MILNLNTLLVQTENVSVVFCRKLLCSENWHWMSVQIPYLFLHIFLDQIYFKMYAYILDFYTAITCTSVYSLENI